MATMLASGEKKRGTLLAKVIGTVLGGLALVGVMVVLSWAMSRGFQSAEIQNIRSAGLVLYAYAHEHNGNFPDSLEKFLQEEGWHGVVFYLPKTKELRWLYHPGHTLGETNAILLETIPAQQKKLKGKAVLTVNQQYEFIKDKR